MLTHSIRLSSYVVAIAICSYHASAMADWGVKSLRIGCNTVTDTIHVEPFIAWNDGNSRYPEFGAETADTNKKLVSGSDTFYAPGKNDSTPNVDTKCKTKTRGVRIIIKGRELTLIENGAAVVEHLMIGNVWDFSGPVYALTSSTKGAWNECNHESEDGSLICSPIKSGKKNVSVMAAVATVAEIQRLLAGGADINSHDTDDTTALHHAAVFQNLDVARFLLNNGANIDPTDSLGRTPLVVSAGSFGSNNSQMVLFLLKEGAAVNGASNGSQTPLMAAASLNDVESCTLLLEWKADPNIRWKGRTALGLARINEHIYVDPKPEFESKNKRIVELLLRAGAIE